MSNIHPLVSQTVNANQGSTASNILQTVNVSLPLLQAIYFNIEISNSLESICPIFSSNNKKRLEKLQPKTTYQIKVSASSNKRGNQTAFHIQSDIMLELICNKDEVLTFNDSCERPVRSDAIAQISEDFNFTIKEECPRVELEFVLFYREINKNKLEYIDTLKIQLEGTYNQDNRDILQACKISLKAPLPEHTAIFHVEAPQPYKFRLSGWSRRGNPCKVNSIDRPTVGLSKFVEGEIKPEDIRNDIRIFSRQCPEHLLIWLQELLNLYSEKLCIIIADQTNSDFPWEMLELGDDQYLGALAVVTRWIEVKHYTKSHELKVQEQLISGKVIAYQDKLKLEHTQEKLIVLDSLITEYCHTTEELKKILSQSLSTIGLVYLGCHGIFTCSTEHRNNVNSLHNPSQEFVHIPFESINKQEGPLPIFFVNASHSARLFSNGNQCYGLPEVILARVAEGYIGTLGFVEKSYSVKIAQSIIKECAAPMEGIRASEILRQLRAHAIMQLNASATLDSWHEFIYTFMYVYYGNPQILLRLANPEAEEVES